MGRAKDLDKERQIWARRLGEETYPLVGQGEVTTFIF